ncbi:hypothetical protein SAMN02745866_00182 [Alteromonadaceae bacterium Bs31]|nr:hypothetical protein SAMN02745866_00182 [Alteromonadaceae bacterium Bs31]
MRVLFILCVSTLGACSLSNTKQVPVAAEPAAAPPPVSRDATQFVEQSLEQRLVAKAENAFRKGRLTAPAHENAYDLFHSVLLINPDNQTARSGLQAILIRFSELVRGAMASRNYGAANALLKQAQTFYPANALLLDLQKEVRALQKQYHHAVLKQPTDDLTLQEFDIPKDLLSSDKEQLLPFINSIAQRVKATDESVMIYARTDAEGRWIYQQMKKFVPGYRIRGDIRLAKTPRIAVMPPL